MTRSERSAMFSAFNIARRLARKGKIDSNCLNRALGLVQSGKSGDYHTSATDCDCPTAFTGCAGSTSLASTSSRCSSRTRRRGSWRWRDARHRRLSRSTLPGYIDADYQGAEAPVCIHRNTCDCWTPRRSALQSRQQSRKSPVLSTAWKFALSVEADASSASSWGDKQCP